MNRKEKMLVPLTICHLVLTALAIVLSVIGLATILRIADAPYEYSVTILILISGDTGNKEKAQQTAGERKSKTQGRRVRKSIDRQRRTADLL